MDKRRIERRYINQYVVKMDGHILSDVLFDRQEAIDLAIQAKKSFDGVRIEATPIRVWVDIDNNKLVEFDDNDNIVIEDDFDNYQLSGKGLRFKEVHSKSYEFRDDKRLSKKMAKYTNTDADMLNLVIPIEYLSFTEERDICGNIGGPNSSIIRKRYAKRIKGYAQYYKKQIKYHDIEYVVKLPLVDQRYILRNELENDEWLLKYFRYWVVYFKQKKVGIAVVRQFFRRYFPDLSYRKTKWLMANCME